MKQYRILIAEPENFSIKALSKLQDIATVDCRDIDQREIRRALEEYDVIWVRLRLHIRREDFPKKLRCKFVVSATTGTDHLDLDGLQKCGVNVLCLREERDFLETIGVTAELTLGLILALVRRLPAAVNSVSQQGRWDRDAFRGVEIYGKTAGIIGLGRLGRKMSQFLKALGMKIVGWDPYAQPVPGVVPASSLNALLQESDVVTVHVPLNEETHGLFTADCFSAMQKGSFFINTSRGALVDEIALLESLQSGHLGGAAVDVLCGEPDIDANNPLVGYARAHDNLLITPHIGGAVAGVMGRCELHMASILIESLAKLMMQ